MRKERINDKEGFFLITIFVTGSTLIVGIGKDVKNDAWIAGIFGILMSLPMILMYSRILSLYQGRDLFDILEITMGRVAGKAAAALYIWYSLHVGALIIRVFGEFINTVTMPETPMLVPMLFLALCCIISVRNGIEVIARTASFLVPIVIVLIVIVQLLAIPKLDTSNIKPVLGRGIAPVIMSGFTVFAFPFAETVLMTGTFFTLKSKKSIYKVYFYGILFAGAIIIFLAARNIMILGDTRQIFYFPSHVALSRVSVGVFLQRIEVAVAFVFIMGVFFKASVCLFVTCKGLRKLIGLHDYRSIVIQAGLIMTFLSYGLFDNIIDMQAFEKVYPYYAFPFQVILPLIVWCLAELKARKKKPQKAVQAAK